MVLFIKKIFVGSKIRNKGRENIIAVQKTSNFFFSNFNWPYDDIFYLYLCDTYKIERNAFQESSIMSILEHVLYVKNRCSLWRSQSH